MKSIENFLGFGEGDICTLSDLQTQKEFGEMSVDFAVKEVRTYKEPGGFFTYTGYICEYEPKDGEPQTIMLLVRQMGADFDLLAYYLDKEGDAGESPVFTEDGEDLLDTLDVTMYNDKDEEINVTWHKKKAGTTFGVEAESSSTDNDTKTLVEYYTEDDTGGNNHAFLEWTGDAEDGYIELWYGCEIRVDDAELYHTKGEE